ncbi:MAG: hypothetical protein JXR76_26145 [Deltaproteobacteria bacterium]|nr:hypothetical protein [Deltaproteobacteria bacterium]
MVDRTTLLQRLRRMRGDKWRYTAALILSVCVHLIISLIYAPDYQDVKDVAVEFELVGDDGQQPLAPEADGPRTTAPEPEQTPDEEEPLPEPAPPLPQEGTLLGDTDLEKDSAGVTADTDCDSGAGTDSDTPSPEDTASDTDTGTASDTATTTDTESDVDSASDTVTESDTRTDTDSETGDSDTATDSDSETHLDSETAPIRIAKSTDGDTEADSAVMASSDTETGTDSGTPGNRFPGSAGASGGEEGICLHDVFAFAKENPSWMAWLSMKAFAGTRYERGLADILRSFYLYNEMVSATEIDPMTELEGVLISADDFSQYDSYQVVATYNVGQDTLKNRLEKNMGKKPGFSINKTKQGISGIHQDSYRWDLVGSGRVLVASDAKKGALNPKWPAAVTCMMPRPPYDGDAQKHFEMLVRSKLGPVKTGERWPVMLMASRDPGAVGLYYQPELAQMFDWAILRGYFSDPIQVEGEARFKGDPADMAKVDAFIKILLTRAKWLRLLGFGSMVDGLEYRIEGTTLHFKVPMTEQQAVALMKLIQNYSTRLNAKFTTP